MKRSITLILLLALFSGMLTGCASPDAKYHPKSSDVDYKWVCDEIDMWFLYKDDIPFGELTLNGETKEISVIFCIGDSVKITEHGEYLFVGAGRFHKKWFTLKVGEEYIDYVGFEELTFRRVELDEEELAWRETLDPPGSVKYIG